MPHTPHIHEAFFDKAQESLAILDKDLNFVDVNEALLSSLQLRKEQIIGKNVAEISPGIEETERYKLYLDVLHTGKSAIVDEARVHPSLGDFVSRISIFKVGEGLGLAAVNIGDMKEAVEELEAFVYKSSHDMRSPIASILGLLNLALDNNDPETTKQYLTIIKEQSERLDNILRKLVETARIHKGEKAIHPVDFHQLIHEVLESLSYTKGFGEIRIEKNISVQQQFCSDKMLLTSLCQNLVDNAVKYKKENCNDSFIKITVAGENEGVRILVEDNGIGIAESHQKNIFNMFFRATDKVGGSGLGLYTVNRTVKKLGGKIHFISREKFGTTFSVYLPNAVSALQE